MSLSSLGLGREALRGPVIGLVLTVMAGAVACDGAPKLGPGIAARIDGRDIPYADFSRFLAETAGDTRELQTVAIASLFETFLEEELLYTLALERDLLTSSADRSIAGSLLLDSIEGLEPSEAEVERYYQEHQDDFQLEERVRLQQMLVQEEGVLDQAYSRLEADEPWNVVAKFMEEEHGALVGGQGVLSREEMPLRFVDSVFSLEAGEHTVVLKAEYGYHLFMVEQRFPAGLAPLVDVRDEIVQRLRTARADTALSELLAEAKERYNVQVADRNLPFERSASSD